MKTVLVLVRPDTGSVLRVYDSIDFASGLIRKLADIAREKGLRLQSASVRETPTAAAVASDIEGFGAVS